MAEELNPDLAVIGGGPGGIAAALAAAAAGLSVVLVEKARTGGSNLTSGAVPAAALAAAGIQANLAAAPGFGVSAGPLQVDLGAVRAHVAGAIDAAGLNTAAERLAAHDVRVIAGPARFTAARVVTAGDAIIRPRHTILAVGGVPLIPDIPGLAAIPYLTPRSDFDWSRKPTHLVVLGADGHALAMAQSFARLGIDVTILDPGPALVGADPEMAAIVLEGVKADGVRLRTMTPIVSMAERRGGIRIVIADATEGERAVDASHVLVMAGRTPAVEDLGLVAAGIAHTGAGIVVNRGLRTANRRVFAIGDCIAGPALAGRAVDEANAVVRAVLYRLPVRRSSTRVPVVAFTDPGLASIGLGEAEARRRYARVQVLRFPMVGSDLAVAERQPAGAIKVLAGPNGRVLGAVVVGRNAAELIAPWALAIARRIPITALRDLPLPYPSRSEIARHVASRFEEDGLTQAWRRRIISVFRQFG